MRLPTFKLWPGQVKAGIAALEARLWTDPATGARSLVYEVDKEKIVRDVFKACVNARNERAKVLKRRAEKRKLKEELSQNANQETP